MIVFGCAMTPEKKPGPRMSASLEMTKQGERLLESGRPDDAIRVLEQAVSLDPSNGQSYYYLSEAWLAKGEENLPQAAQFNRLAGIYLASDDEWMGKVESQRVRIEEVRNSTRPGL